MPIFHYDIEQNSAKWFQVRAGIPTASEMKRIVTPGGKPSKSDTTARYMNRLLFEFVSGVPFQDNDYQSEYMADGHDNEEKTIATFEMETGMKAEKVGFVTTDDGMAGASPDRIVKGVGTVEAKSPIGPTQIGYLLNKDALIEQYWVQAQSQIWVCDFDKSFIVSDHDKLPPLILEVGRDEEYIGKLEAAVRKFIDEMLQKRLDLEKRFGPFVRPTFETKTEPDPFGLGTASLMDDLEAIMASWEKEA